MNVVNTRQQCFPENSSDSGLRSSYSTIKTMMNNLYAGLHELLHTLLKNPETRESVLEYLAEVINKNSSRAHIQVSIPRYLTLVITDVSESLGLLFSKNLVILNNLSKFMVTGRSSFLCKFWHVCQSQCCHASTL